MVFVSSTNFFLTVNRPTHFFGNLVLYSTVFDDTSEVAVQVVGEKHFTDHFLTSIHDTRENRYPVCTDKCNHGPV
jgi:hypothetical protein